LDLIITDNAKDREIEAGDIVVVDEVSFLVRMDHGVGEDALLLGLDGNKDNYYAYMNMESLRKNVSQIKDAQLYKAKEYDLRLFKKIIR